MQTTKAQSQSILEHLKQGNSITPIEALNKFGCFRLGARIFDLKKYFNASIKTEMIKSEGKRFAKYSLIN